MTRPDVCPNCSASVTQHTGDYCHRCGEPLVKPTPLPRPKRDLPEGFPFHQ